MQSVTHAELDQWVCFGPAARTLLESEPSADTTVYTDALGDQCAHWPWL